MDSQTIVAHETIFLLRSPWAQSLHGLVAVVDEDLLIACPFLKRSVAEDIISILGQRNLLDSVRVRVITDLRPESALAGSLDLSALTEFGRRIPAFELTHLPSVHAKVYVADTKMAIVTSGNLTEAGLYGNVEYGIALKENGIVKEVRSDFEGYASLGAKVSVEDVRELSSEMEELRVLYKRAEKSIRAQARRAFEEKLRLTHVRLLRHRAKGKSTHAIFADTIKFLLAKGPLLTEELHPFIQLIHPDLCDDTVDRVIDEVHFGKKWKHYVRTAQQHLKRRGEIEFDGTRWRLTKKV
jgi:hypothetical protein